MRYMDLLVKGEEQKKEAILSDMERRHLSIINALRAEMRTLYYKLGRPVHANDAREVLDKWGLRTGPWMGSLFRCKEWKGTGEFVKSSAEGSHARIVWTYIPRE